jgi:hypothetical protein
MKFFAFAAVLALSTTAFSASNSSVNDLQYLPNAKVVFGATALNAIKFSSRDFNGTSTDHSTSSGTVVTQNIGFALMDNFSLSADLAYQNSKSEVNGSNESKTTGLGDVVFNGRFRVLDSENRLDILGKLAVSPGDNEIDSSGDSNAYSGGHELSVGAEYGIKQGTYQWSLSALLNHAFEATSKDKENDTKYKDEAHNGLNLGANLLTQISESNYIKNFAGVEFTEEYEDDDNSTYSGSTNYNLGAEFQHVMNKDLYLKAGFNSFIGGSGYNFIVMFYTVGANYQF